VGTQGATPHSYTHTPTNRNREDPPDSPGGMGGGGGHTQGQSTLIVNKSFKGTNSTGPIIYNNC
jgi:hypothetical protein